MKNKTISMILCAIVLCCSCINDLDVTQKSSINASSMWQEESDFTAAMYGCCYSFRNAYKINLSYWGDFRSGIIGPGLGSFNANAHVNNVLTSSEGKGTNWSTLYTCINDCNVLLKHIDDISWADQTKRNQIAANAYFLRAYCYFTVVRTWGDAPLMTAGIESDKDDVTPSRSPAHLIYSQIESDLNQAESLMPESVKDCSIGNLGAINMLQAEYYLWCYQTRENDSAQLTAAETAVNKVLENSSYGLLDNYADVFSMSNKKNKEIIFCIHFQRETEEMTTFYDDYLIPTSKCPEDAYYIENDLIKTGSQDQWYSFSTTFQNLIKADEADTRAATSFTSYTVPETGNTYSWINKFPGEWESNVRYFTSDIPLYRFAEALLFKAEIELEKGGDPLQWLNKVAKRAYGKDNYYTTELTSSQIREALLNERLKEFAAEGKSWYDYIRLGYAFIKIPSLVGRQNETNILLWPIASACFTDNPNIRQTVGYN